MTLQFEILRTGKGWDKLDAEVQKVRNESWYRHVAVIRHSTWDSSWMNYGADIDFDPVPIFENLNIPVLSLLGESDVETPIQETVTILELINKERNKDFTVKVFPGADHHIELPRQIKNRPRYAPGYLDTMINWTLERVFVKQQNPFDKSSETMRKERLSYHSAF
jgi:pimeloyl-ACP methyl ester carboxylesterase